jgi:hypothetical protein
MVPVLEILWFLVLVADKFVRACSPVSHFFLLSFCDAFNRELTVRKQHIRDVFICQAFLAHDACLHENFFVNKESAKSFFEKLHLIVDAAFVVVAPTNKVNSIAENSVLVKLGFLRAYGVSSHFLS